MIRRTERRFFPGWTAAVHRALRMVVVGLTMACLAVSGGCRGDNNSADAPSLFGKENGPTRVVPPATGAAAGTHTIPGAGSPAGANPAAGFAGSNGYTTGSGYGTGSGYTTGYGTGSPGNYSVQSAPPASSALPPPPGTASQPLTPQEMSAAPNSRLAAAGGVTAAGVSTGGYAAGEGSVRPVSYEAMAGTAGMSRNGQQLAWRSPTAPGASGTPTALNPGTSAAPNAAPAGFTAAGGVTRNSLPVVYVTGAAARGTTAAANGASGMAAATPGPNSAATAPAATTLAPLLPPVAAVETGTYSPSNTAAAPETPPGGTAIPRPIDAAEAPG